MAKTVSEVFVETLIEAGVRRVYGVVGDSLNGLTDAIRKSEQIEWLHVRPIVIRQSLVCALDKKEDETYKYTRVRKRTKHECYQSITTLLCCHPSSSHLSNSKK